MTVLKNLLLPHRESWRNRMQIMEFLAETTVMIIMNINGIAPILFPKHSTMDDLHILELNGSGIEKISTIGITMVQSW